MLETHPVSIRVNSTACDGPDLLEPVEALPPESPGLFDLLDEDLESPDKTT